MLKEELLVGLSEEQIEKVKQCKNGDELLNFAKQEGIELTDEQLEAVSGGFCSSNSDVPECPHCHSKSNVKEVHMKGSSGRSYKCKKCNCLWTIW